MALTQYSRNITDGLILHLDAADPNSYRGENTTNVILSETNSFPTYGNGWGTYNTNQYGSGTFFSIPSISSVSGNVVTTSSAHPFRTYDVVRPQTSGGGLTANTDYYIKRISSTQFTLHTYNSTQDGTLGFRVLDPIVRDDRISVNATSFPTSWWGAPHLPNSGIIKTIVPNGFNFQGRVHDCLRMNWYRPDGVTDGMAYGVTPTISPGNATWTLSCYMRAANSAAVGQSVYWQSYSTSNANTWVANNFTVSSEWQKFSLVGTPWPQSSSATALLLYWFPNAAPMAVDVAEIQIEQKTAARTFTPAYRGSTFSSGSQGSNIGHQFNGYFYSGGWSDLSPYGHEATITNGDPTFTTEFGGAVQFTGSQGYTIPYSSAFDCQEVTVLVWTKTNATTQNGFWFEKGVVNTQYSLFQEGGSIQWRTYWTGDGSYTTQSTTTASYVNTSNYFQVAGTYNGQQKITYINGVAVTTTNETKQLNYNSSGCTIGMYNSGGYFYNGNIAIIQVYNRALSAAEILDNYNKYKSRFGL